MIFTRQHLLLAGAGLAAGAAAWYVTVGTNPVDELADLAVALTTTDEERIARLSPETQGAAMQLLAALAARGISVKVGQTFRTPADEKAAIDADRSAVTSHSWHELGRAWDLYPIDPGTGSPDMKGANLDLFRAMHETAAQLGWRGLAFDADGNRRYITTRSGKRIWDGGHLEWRAPYASIGEAVAAEGAAYGIS